MDPARKPTFITDAEGRLATVTLSSAAYFALPCGPTNAHRGERWRTNLGDAAYPDWWVAEAGAAGSVLWRRVRLVG